MKSRFADGVQTAPATINLALAEAHHVPDDDHWLAPPEIIVLQDLRIATRAMDWRLGRWAAKQAAKTCLGGQGISIEHSELSIISGMDGIPIVQLPARLTFTPLSISISHRENVGFAAAALGRMQLGCDVEKIEPRSNGFVTTYFTDTERELVESNPIGRDLMANLIWSAKESALKALGDGLRRDTRDVVVGLPDDTLQQSHEQIRNWNLVEVKTSAQLTLTGHWRADDDFVYTVLADRRIRLRQKSG